MVCLQSLAMLLPLPAPRPHPWFGPRYAYPLWLCRQPYLRVSLRPVGALLASPTPAMLLTSDYTAHVTQASPHGWPAEMILTTLPLPYCASLPILSWVGGLAKLLFPHPPPALIAHLYYLSCSLYFFFLSLFHFALHVLTPAYCVDPFPHVHLITYPLPSVHLDTTPFTSCPPMRLLLSGG